MNKYKLLATISYTYAYLLLQKDKRQKGLLSAIGTFCSFSRQWVYRVPALVQVQILRQKQSLFVTEHLAQTVDKSDINLISKEVVAYPHS